MFSPCFNICSPTTIIYIFPSRNYHISNRILHRKNLSPILSSLSFSESYTELQRFHDATLSGGQPCYDQSGFTQYVFDNADFNISTLTSYETFHSLGRLVCSTPKSLSKEPLTRSIKAIPNNNFTSIMG